MKGAPKVAALRGGIIAAGDGARLRAVQLLKDAAYPEAAVPIAPLIGRIAHMPPIPDRPG